MKSKKHTMILVITLVLLSVTIYYLQYRIFHQRTNTFFYLFQDLAFVPIQVLLVTLLLNRFLSGLENGRKQKKINVIISTFFVETGSEILGVISEFNCNKGNLYQLLECSESKKHHGRQLRKKLDAFNYEILLEEEGLQRLRSLLNDQRSFMLNMLGNDNLLEHDSFTDMLWAVFHVADELKLRPGTLLLQEQDQKHLTVDIQRAYGMLVREWANYMHYMRTDYPYLYLIALEKAKGTLTRKS